MWPLWVVGMQEWKDLPGYKFSFRTFEEPSGAIESEGQDYSQKNKGFITFSHVMRISRDNTKNKAVKVAHVVPCASGRND